MSAPCPSDCACWDCATDRHNSIRFALVACAVVAVAGGVFVAYEASGAFDLEDGDPGRDGAALTS